MRLLEVVVRKLSKSSMVRYSVVGVLKIIMNFDIKI